MQRITECFELWFAGVSDEKKDSWSFVLSNTELRRICGTDTLDDFIHWQQKSYIAHVIRKGDDSLTKRITFNDDEAHRRGR